MRPRAAALKREFDGITAGISKIEQAASTEGRDLSEAEEADLDKLYKRAEELKPEIEGEGRRAETLSASAEVLAKLGIAGGAPILTRTAPAGKAPEMTAGEYLSLLWRSEREGDAEAAELLTRAVATQTTANTAGIIANPILGGIIKFADDRRPVLSSFTQRPHPGTKNWTRPHLYRRVAVGNQATELDELSSQALSITGTPVSTKTYGGVLRISQQDVDFTDPGALQIVLDDFVGVYAEATEAVACTALGTLASNTSTWTGTDVGTIVASITAGILAVYGRAKRMPDTCWLSLDESMTLAGTTNADDSVTAMTLIRQALADAGVPMRFITGPDLPADTRIIGCSNLVEGYENQRGFVQGVDVSHFGIDVAYAGYYTTFGRAEGFVSLEPA